jgi:hypothetical protein
VRVRVRGGVVRGGWWGGRHSRRETASGVWRVWRVWRVACGVWRVACEGGCEGARERIGVMGWGLGLALTTCVARAPPDVSSTASTAWRGMRRSYPIPRRFFARSRATMLVGSPS